MTAMKHRREQVSAVTKAKSWQMQNVNGVTFADIRQLILRKMRMDQYTIQQQPIKGDAGAVISGGMSAADIQAEFTEDVLQKLTAVEKTTATVDGKDGVAATYKC